MYCHKKDYEIRYTDVDLSDNLKLSSLLSMMEESACFSADELGFGYEFLKPKNYGFIMVNWYIELFSPIKLGDVVTIHTWPIKPKRLIIFRDFELYVGEKKVGVATSRWCVVDLNTFSMLPSSAVLSPDMPYNDFRSVDVTAIKIPEISVSEPSYSKAVSYSDYDHYNHVNNTKYADFLLDAFSVDEIADKFIETVKITYVKQSKYGDVLDFYRQMQDDGTWIVEGRANGELRVQMAVKFNEKL
ncbi:MAG: hypothetical protein K2N14_04920 [Clostridia bacterium]|nr:hypothetical protein [Clostridia bacterium]